MKLFSFRRNAFPLSIFTLLMIGTAAALVTQPSGRAFIASISPLPLATPERVLTKAEADAFVDTLVDKLGDVIEDEEDGNAIADKWQAHNFTGWTRPQILNTLYKDASTVVDDKALLTELWNSWKQVGIGAPSPQPRPVQPQPKSQVAAPAAQAQGDILEDDDIDDLLSDLSESLYDHINDEGAINTIVDRWFDREDLDGKTQTQLLGMLFNDVRAVVRDKPTQDRIWADWQSDFGENGEGNEQTAAQTEAKKQVAEWVADAKKNEATYRMWFKAAKLDGGFDPERVAGFCFKLLKQNMDDKGCWSLASFKGLVAYLHIEGTNTKDADIQRVVAFGKEVAACTPRDKCSQLKARVVNTFEDFYFDQIASQTKPAMMIVLNAVGVQSGYDPNKFAGYCLRQSNPPDGQMGTCDEFVKTTLFAYWRFVNSQNRAGDKANLEAFLNRTVRCRPPLNCVQIVRDLKNGAANGPTAKTTALDPDGFFDFKGVYAACMTDKTAADPCSRYSCRNTVMGQMFMWAALNNPYKIASGGDKNATPLLQEKLADFQKWLGTLGDLTNVPAGCK